MVTPRLEKYSLYTVWIKFYDQRAPNNRAHNNSIRTPADFVPTLEILSLSL